MLRKKGTGDEGYMVYVLRSVPTPARTYCGSTNDLVHRFRQHNGVIGGGAVATKTSQPWRIAAVVFGFPTKASAMRFEWFVKVKHSRKVYLATKWGGLNSIQRRAALLCAAYAQMWPEDQKKLMYACGDDYFRRCLEMRRGTVHVSRPPPKKRRCNSDKRK